MWALGYYSFGKFMELHRMMLNLAVRAGMAGIKAPLNLMPEAPQPVSVVGKGSRIRGVKGSSVSWK